MLQLAKNPILSARSKHIDIVYHFVRERVASDDVSFTYIPTDKMLADIFTKCLPKIKHEKMRSALGLRS
jgi:KUP system potassium uptake protein